MAFWSKPDDEAGWHWVRNYHFCDRLWGEFGRPHMDAMEGGFIFGANLSIQYSALSLYLGRLELIICWNSYRAFPIEMGYEEAAA
jgi:hypothetical protein